MSQIVPSAAMLRIRAATCSCDYRPENCRNCFTFWKETCAMINIVSQTPYPGHVSQVAQMCANVESFHVQWGCNLWGSDESLLALRKRNQLSSGLTDCWRISDTNPSWTHHSESAVNEINDPTVVPQRSADQHKPVLVNTLQDPILQDSHHLFLAFCTWALVTPLDSARCCSSFWTTEPGFTPIPVLSVMRGEISPSWHPIRDLDASYPGYPPANMAMENGLNCSNWVQMDFNGPLWSIMVHGSPRLTTVYHEIPRITKRMVEALQIIGDTRYINWCRTSSIRCRLF